MGYAANLRRTVSALTLALLFGMGSSAARAETLLEAMAAAYARHPSILEERAEVRATDEQLAQAQAGYRPRISANADYGIADQSTVAKRPADQASFARQDGVRHPHSYGFQLQQPLFDGGSTLGAVREADATIHAAREKLRSVEQKVLLDVVKAYSAVIRDRAIAGLRHSNLTILTRELEGTQERFDAGEATRTDVAQAQSRRARAAAELDQAQANQRAALAEYERATGHPAGLLATPQLSTKQLPASLEEAVDISATENPEVVQAAFLEEASEHQIAKIQGELLPQLNLSASHVDRYDVSGTIESQTTQQLTARLNIPLYSGGETEARIRAAKQQRQGRLQAIEQARQNTRANTVAAWSQLLADRSQVAAVKEQVRAATEALLGVREEQRAGQRTLLDVLNAAQELIEAKVSLERSKRSLVVSSYSVLGAIGRLTASSLSLEAEPYDVEANYQQTNRRAWGIAIDREDGYAVD